MYSVIDLENQSLNRQYHKIQESKLIDVVKTKKNCFRYLKLMSPLNVTICTTISYTL